MDKKDILKKGGSHITWTELQHGMIFEESWMMS